MANAEYKKRRLLLDAMSLPIILQGYSGACKTI
jgi:hypothetical protein